MKRRLIFCAALAVLALCAPAAQASGPSADIVGGTPVPSIGPEWPYIAQVVATDGVDDYFVCAGTLIRPDWVLTAAHCQDEDLPISAAVIGAKDFDTGDFVEADRVVVNPAFNPATGENDLALVHLVYRQSTSHVIPRLSTAANDPADGATVHIAGWGDTSDGSGLGSDQLLEADVEIVSNSSCATAYAGAPDPVAIFASQVCAAHFDGANSRDACQGDSGGPMVADSPDGDSLVGIISGGEGCAQEPYPGIYTRVSSHVDWIASVIDTQWSIQEWEYATADHYPTGYDRSFNFMLTDSGPNTAKIHSVKVTGDPAFSLSRETCADTSENSASAPGSGCNIYVDYKPRVDGPHEGEIELTTDGLKNSTVRFPLRLTSTPPAPTSLVFARGVPGEKPVRVFKSSGGRKLSLGLTFELKYPADPNPTLGWPRCKGPGLWSYRGGTMRVRLPGRRKALTRRFNFMEIDGGRCVASAAVALKRSDLGKSAQVSATSDGSSFVQPATMTGRVHIPKRISK